MITTQESLQQEFNDISQTLESLNGVFCQMWLLGRPTLTNEIPTAAVSFNKQGACIDFLINPIFWSELNYDTKVFLICHECMHVILEHGTRSDLEAKSEAAKEDPYTQLEQQLANVAMDVVINETLIHYFGLKRSSLNFEDGIEAISSESEDEKENPSTVDVGEKSLPDLSSGAFLDTVFDKISPGIEPEKSYEHYLDVLVDYFKDEIKNAKDQQKAIQQLIEHLKNNAIDDHSAMSDSFEGSGEDEKDTESEKIVKEILKNAEKEDVSDFNKAMNETFGKGYPGDPLVAGALQEIIEAEKLRSVKTQRKWEKLFRRYKRKIQEDNENSQWIKSDKRQNVLPKDFLLPSENTTDDVENKIFVWLFIDSSGSCHHLKDQFFRAAYSLDLRYFDVKLFSRTTEVQELDYDKPQVTGYGSDDYRCIERYIQNQLDTRKISKYPEIVMHFTDGHDCSGEMVKPQRPLNWWWFMTDEMYTAWIPKECINNNRVYKLSDFE